jgi:hypothetical protein
VTVTDLVNAARPRMTTISKYLPVVIAAAGPGARRTYGSHRSRMAVVWPDRRLDTIAATGIEAQQHETQRSYRLRRNARGDRHAGEHAGRSRSG